MTKLQLILEHIWSVDNATDLLAIKDDIRQLSETERGTAIKAYRLRSKDLPAEEPGDID
jgi:hypothetical protein